MNIILSMLYRQVVNGKLVVNPYPIAQRVLELAPHLGRAGVTHVLFGPLTMSQGGRADNADGYGKQADLDVGQFPGRPTRNGPAALLLQAITALHEAGVEAMEDAVIHQYAGRPPFYERGADGKVDETLFPKPAGMFVPNVTADPVFDAEGNQAFGQLVSYLHSLPKGYMTRGVIESIRWRWRVFGLAGMRLDDTKGENILVTNEILEAAGIRDGFCFGECWAGQVELERWVAQSRGKRTLDFPWHWALKNACEGGSFRALTRGALWQVLPGQSVLFIDTADTDNNNGENIRWNKIWAYVLSLTVPAAATLVYARDYLPECYGLQAGIDNAMWFSRKFAFGGFGFSLVEDSFIAWWRDGNGGAYGWSGGMLAAISSDPINWQGRWMWTPFKPGTALHNYAPTLATASRVNQDGWSYVSLPPNHNGAALSYGLFAPDGVQGQPIPHPPVGKHGSGDFLNFSSVTVRPQ